MSRGEARQGITHHAKGCVLSLTVSPRSAVNRLEVEDNGSLRVRLTAPPVDGAANSALLKFLASVLDVPRSRISVLSGAQSRQKRILVEGLTPDTAQVAIARAAAPRI